jgi:hypothetical protein
MKHYLNKQKVLPERQFLNFVGLEATCKAPKRL